MEMRLFLVLSIFLLSPTSHAFEKCGGTSLNRKLEDAASKAAHWLREFLDKNPTYDDLHIDSAAVHSLALAGYHANRNVVSQIKMSRTNGGRLGLHVNGIIASCQNPSRKMIKLLRHCTETSKIKCGLTHSFQYLTAALALCNSGHIFDSNGNPAIKRIERILKSYSNKAIDTFALAILTRSCIHRNKCNSSQYQNNCQNASKKNNNATVQALLKKQNKQDGSFGGNSISTALAVQALLANQTPLRRWNCSKTMEYLLRQQKHDGSFGGLMATIQILPVLNGATLLDNHRIKQRCNTTLVDRERNRVHNQHIPVVSTTSDDIVMDDENITVTLAVNVTGKFDCLYNVIVKNGSTALDVLQAPNKNYTCCDEHLCDQEVSFRAIYTRYGPYIEAIGRYEENPTARRHWLMYTDDNTLSKVGVDSFFPTNGSQITFKYEIVN